ncbi:hypothetical protein AMJ71_00495 [candidate division TA06 bacterium SM1_40]|uniref:Putative zinc-finger domain-containing protein n=1 Tax=candidate division TA06 bacterium SM1_40 TaxID=1703773 RepID=A0A0S8JRW2_UNCT6|nr:MAG: hypothetical protein AMJ71_00495 [candidate division TA06 bacterium SM1_40]
MDGSDHDRMRRLLPAYVEGDLAEEEREQVSQHLSECSECAAEARSMERVRDALRGLEQVDVPLGFGDAVWRKIEREPVWRTWLRRVFIFAPQRMPMKGLATASALVLIVALTYLVSTRLQERGVPSDAVLMSDAGPVEEEPARGVLTDKKESVGTESLAEGEVDMQSLEDEEASLAYHERATPASGAREEEMRPDLSTLDRAAERGEGVRAPEPATSEKMVLAERDEAEAVEDFMGAASQQAVDELRPGAVLEAPGAILMPSGGARVELNWLPAGERQVVFLRVHLDVDGSVLDVEMERPGDVEVDSTVLDIVHSWKFAPIVVDGRAQKVWVTVPVAVSEPMEESSEETIPSEGGGSSTF